jgi:hypothetical protein
MARHLAGHLCVPVLGLFIAVGAAQAQELDAIAACSEMIAGGLRPLAGDRADRFLGKVEESTARCRGGARALQAHDTPWVDWAGYWAAGDETTRSLDSSGTHLFDDNVRGLDGALMDLEYQRMELIKFNLFDNNGTFERYLSTGIVDGEAVPGSTLRIWPAMRLPQTNPAYASLQVDAAGNQVCTGELVRFRNLTGICNDMQNPAMGSTGMVFARNTEFESTFPELGLDPLARNRHGTRIGLLSPDPQVISRKLLTRDQTGAVACNEGKGANGDVSANCPYKKAPFFNVIAAFWIQFMTHDWFSHLDDGQNDKRMMTDLGCTTQRVGNVERPLTPADVARLGCRPGDKIDAALIAEETAPGTFESGGKTRLMRSYKTTRNMVTAWWDTSQIYGFDERSATRVKRDPMDRARLQTVSVGNRVGAGEREGYLPVFGAPCANDAATGCERINPQWSGQETAAFPDNWSVGLSFLHTVFTREHNNVVEEFRRRMRETPNADSGLRNPERPNEEIPYRKLSDDELFGIARLVVAAEIAKIHTIEWTPQLLYDDPLNAAMNSNWSGLFAGSETFSAIFANLVDKLRQSKDPLEANALYSAFAAGPGIFGLGSEQPNFWRNLAGGSWNQAHYLNGGTNHFGSPFAFPEEFPSVYRLHPLIPDLLEFRELDRDPNRIRKKIATVGTFRGLATPAMRDGGLANWAVSLGRQRLGLLTLRNHPAFLQNLDLSPRIATKIDIAALDIIRDREHGIARFNEFRRQIGLQQVTSFDDFIDKHLPAGSPELAEQRSLATTLREVYGRHVCDDSKVITSAQRDRDGRPITDCLGHANGSTVDNVEDIDLTVGLLAESTRPHGFAISETQFHIFILNASRRLFSDRFFTSGFRPEIYGTLGVEWVTNNGPTGRQWEAGEPNGHKQEVSPMKRVLLRAMPELAGELATVVNAFDPWARDRGRFYTLAWKPRADAADDEAFKQP